MFERLIGLANDVDLLAEEYDTVAKRMVGNFPQAFTHVVLVHTGMNLMRYEEEMAKATGQPSSNGRADDRDRGDDSRVDAFMNTASGKQ